VRRQTNKDRGGHGSRIRSKELHRKEQRKETSGGWVVRYQDEIGKLGDGTGEQGGRKPSTKVEGSE